MTDTTPDGPRRTPTVSGGALAALGALVAGLAAGLAMAALDAGTALRVVAWIEPIGTLWVNAVRMTVIPLIVASLVVAVAGAGVRTVGRLGTRAFAIFVALLALAAVVGALAVPALFTLLVVDADAASAIRAGASAVTRPELPSISSWIVGLVPTNPIRAAADGAMLPLIVVTLAFGLALGRAAEPQRATVVAFFRGVADAMTTLVRWILALAPVGVFALAFVLATRLGTGVVGAVAFYLAAHSAVLVLMTALLYPIAVVAGRVSPARFARATLPAQVVAATTRSSMAALPAMVTSTAETLALPRAVTSFALPLAVSTFRLNQPISWQAMAFFAAALYGMELDAAAVLTFAVTSVLMSFSVPGIPSGGLFIIAPFLASLGIPPEAVGVLIALDLVPDVFKTLLNVTASFSVAALLGRSAGGDGEETAD